MQVVFCAHFCDEKSIQALEILRAKGCRTQVIKNGELAPQTAVAIFSFAAGSSNTMPGRYLRIAAHQLLSVRPGWATSTPFLAAINGSNKKWNSDRFAEAVLGLAKMYELWFCFGGMGLPWGGSPSGKERLDDLEEWKDEAHRLLLPKPNFQLTPTLHLCLSGIGQEVKEGLFRGFYRPSLPSITW